MQNDYGPLLLTVLPISVFGQYEDGLYVPKRLSANSTYYKLVRLSLCDRLVTAMKSQRNLVPSFDLCQFFFRSESAHL